VALSNGRMFHSRGNRKIDKHHSQFSKSSMLSRLLELIKTLVQPPSKVLVV